MLKSLNEEGKSFVLSPVAAARARRILASARPHHEPAWRTCESFRLLDESWTKRIFGINRESNLKYGFEVTILGVANSIVPLHVVHVVVEQRSARRELVETRLASNSGTAHA